MARYWVAPIHDPHLGRCTGVSFLNRQVPRQRQGAVRGLGCCFSLGYGPVNTVVALHGTPRIVGPCMFRKLWRAGKIRYTVRVDGRTYRRMLKRMPGDKYARLHGCDR